VQIEIDGEVNALQSKADFNLSLAKETPSLLGEVEARNHRLNR